MRNALFILLSFFAFSCKKERCLQDNLSGKLKSIEYRFQDSSGHIVYLEYDELSQNLVRVTDETDDSLRFVLTIAPERNNQIVIRSSLSPQQVIVNLLQDKNVESIVLVDTLTLTSSLFYTAKYDSASIDTLSIPGDLWISDIQNYDFVTDGFNCLSHTISWTQMDFFIGIRRRTDTVQYVYSPHVYNNFVPLQNSFQSTAFALTGTPTEDVFNSIFLEINGYTFFNRNKHLIQSVTSVNRGYQTNYSYKFNAKNQVSEMFISNPDGTGTSIRCILTYYE